MRILLGRFFEIVIAYLLISYILNSLNISISSHLWLATSITAWLLYGHHIKKKLKYQGMLSSWYAPLTKINERNLSLSFICLSLYIALQYPIYFQKDIILIAVISLLIHVIFFTYYNKLKIPFFKLILIISSIETYLIAILIIKITNGIFENILIIMMIQNVLLILISKCNYYLLRNFVFYQKLIIKKNNFQNELSYSQKLNIAVHEASHLIMYVFYKDVPHDIQILLFNEAKKINKSAQGLVIAKVPLYNTGEFLKWRMMLSISGIRGELLIFDNHSHGSESDFQQWRELAHIYLLNFEKNYIAQPINVKDLNNNKVLETKLYKEQIYIIDKFLKNNKSILLKISKQALVFNKLTYKQIYPHFKNIKNIKEMPKE
jgi:hypothetical protein